MDRSNIGGKYTFMYDMNTIGINGECYYIRI